MRLKRRVFLAAGGTPGSAKAAYFVSKPSGHGRTSKTGYSLASDGRSGRRLASITRRRRRGTAVID